MSFQRMRVSSRSVGRYRVVSYSETAPGQRMHFNSLSISEGEAPTPPAPSGRQVQVWFAEYPL